MLFLLNIYSDSYSMMPLVVGVFLHVLADTLGSVGVIISTLLILWCPWLQVYSSTCWLTPWAAWGWSYPPFSFYDALGCRCVPPRAGWHPGQRGGDHIHPSHSMMPLVVGVFLHVLADTLGSVGVIISTLLILWCPWLQVCSSTSWLTPWAAWGWSSPPFSFYDAPGCRCVPPRPGWHPRQRGGDHLHPSHSMMPLVTGVFLHVLADTLGSVGVIISTLLILWCPWLQVCSSTSWLTPWAAWGWSSPPFSFYDAPGYRCVPPRAGWHPGQRGGDHLHPSHSMMPLVTGVFLHVLADTLGSVGVIISTLLILWCPWLQVCSSMSWLTPWAAWGWSYPPFSFYDAPGYRCVPPRPGWHPGQRGGDHLHPSHSMMPLVTGVFLHVLADTLGSVGVIISTLLILWCPWLQVCSSTSWLTPWAAWGWSSPPFSFYDAPGCRCVPPRAGWHPGQRGGDHIHPSHSMMPLVTGVFLHVLADTLGSVGVIISTLLILWCPWL